MIDNLVVSYTATLAALVLIAAVWGGGFWPGPFADKDWKGTAARSSEMVGTRYPNHRWSPA